jgi:lipopolysaccharide export system permease protein
MTILGSIFMLNVKYNKSKIFSIVSGTLISVLIYYLNYFSNVMGVNEKLPILASTWFPFVILILICFTGMVKINEK